MDKAQHIVGQSRKPCRVIARQAKDGRHVALGLRVYVARRAVTTVSRSEERACEIRQRELFTEKPGHGVPGSYDSKNDRWNDSSIPDFGTDS